MATMLGFLDDVFDIRWRHKLPIPIIASIPLLIVYYSERGATDVVVPLPLRWLLGTMLHLGTFVSFCTALPFLRHPCRPAVLCIYVPPLHLLHEQHQHPRRHQRLGGLAGSHHRVLDHTQRPALPSLACWVPDTPPTPCHRRGQGWRDVECGNGLREQDPSRAASLQPLLDAASVGGVLGVHVPQLVRTCRMSRE